MLVLRRSCGQSFVIGKHGASHCLLAPYWSRKLNKQDLHALQLSQRGVELFCRCENNRVFISGIAKLYMQGMVAL